MNFNLEHFPLFSLSLSSFCVIYPRGRSAQIKTKNEKRVFLSLLFSVEALLAADS
jgi:hypothetical protein